MKPGKRRWAALRYGQKIRNVLLTYYLTPILLILLASGVFFYYWAKRSLDDEMGQRLASIAMSAASHVRGYQVAALELRDKENLTYEGLLKRFERVRDENKIAKIYLFNAKNESLLDTDASIPLGTLYQQNRLHVSELDQATKGMATASVLFQGTNGEFYKSAFAPVIDEGQVLALVGVDGSATFFKNLHLLGRQLAYFILTCVGAIVLVSMIISRKIVTPVALLVSRAQRMGEGHLDEPIEIHAQNEIGFLGFVLDEMRKNIVARDRELQVMLRGIAHEVRNPLGGIELFAGMLEEEVTEPEARQAVAKIQQEVRTLNSLVDEFLDFARGPSLQPAQVQLPSFLQDIKLAFQKELEAKNIGFDVDLNGTRELSFDPDQMRRVFLNLVRNSVQAMPGGGKIQIRAGVQNAGHAEFVVTDTGVGVAAEHIDKIFDPFFTTKERGSGLGLSFARKIVNAHGGEIRFESNPGAGATVTILLPQA
ncbi:MAG TPA: ATP-binding protein [Bdellovibrionota bacterium]|nr:ATP-binding protein [Bdellovibrionota bacterium]